MNKKKFRGTLKTVGVAVGILVILSVFCVVISLVGSVVVIRRTEPYNHGVELALNSPKVQQALGEPITVGWFPQGSVNVAIGGGMPSCTFLSRARGRAHRFASTGQI